MPKKKEDKVTSKPLEVEKKAEEEISPDEEKKRERELFLIQIKFLTNELERFQLKCDDLEEQKKDFVSRYASMETDKNDVIEYLKRTVLEKEDELNVLSARLQSQQRAAEEARDAAQLQHAQTSQELQERIEELSGENGMLATSLASLEEFRRQREQLTCNMESLEQQIVLQKEQHAAELVQLEMSVLQEKQRLAKELERHMAKMAADVQSLVEVEVPEVTRRTLEENRQLLARCNELSDQGEVLIRENMELQRKKKKLKLASTNLEEMLKEFSSTISIQKKVVTQETEKREQLQKELNVSRQEQQQLLDQHKHVLLEMEELRQKLVSVPEPCGDQSAEVIRLEAELQEEKRTCGRMRSIIQETVDTLRQTLMEVLEDQEIAEEQKSLKKQDATQEQEAGVDRWKQLTMKLLTVLDTRKLPGSSAEAPTSDPEADRSAILDEISSYHFHLARYRPGDFGLIAPVTLKPLRSTKGAGSSTLLRKPLGPRTAGSLNLSSSTGRLKVPKNIHKPK